MSTTTAPPEEHAAATPPEPVGPAAPGGTPEPRSGTTFEAIAVIALVVAFGAIVLALFSMGLAARSIDEHRAVADGGGAGGGPVAVSLEEFTIAPAPITATAGGTLAVTNDGTTTHDLTVEDQDVATPTLDAGDSAELALGGLAPGTYTVFCSIPGHREAGMEAQVTVG